MAGGDGCHQKNGPAEILPEDQAESRVIRATEQESCTPVKDDHGELRVHLVESRVRRS
ncbi:hypothetical protein D3C79_888860 [compost metagenome]